MTRMPGDYSETRQAVIIGRPDGTIVHMSDAFARATGLTPDAVVGRAPDAVGLSDGARLRWLLGRLPAVGHGYRFTRVLPTPDGPRAFEVDLHAVDVAGEPLVVATLREPEPETTSDARIPSAIVDAAPLGLVVYDERLRIVRVNRAVERAGRIGPMHIGMRLTAAFPDVSAVVVDAIERVFRTGEPAVNRQIESSAGETFLMTLFPIRDANGRVVLAGCIYTDVSDRVAAERALAASEQN
ncbi:MAG TPA: PAS domain-containing protein, partial [Gaiellales bacterium]